MSAGRVTGTDRGDPAVPQNGLHFRTQTDGADNAFRSGSVSVKCRSCVGIGPTYILQVDGGGRSSAPLLPAQIRCFPLRTRSAPLSQSQLRTGPMSCSDSSGESVRWLQSEAVVFARR